MLQDARLQQDGEQHAVTGAPQVRAVVDVVRALALHPDAVTHVHHGIDDGRHRDHEDDDQRPGLDQDEGEQHRRDRARGAEAAVVGVAAIAQVAGQDRDQQRRQIEAHEAPGPGQAELAEIVLHRPAEEEQGDHVEQQVLHVGVDEAIAEQAPELAPALDRRWPQDQRRQQPGLLPGHEREHAGDGDQGKGDGRVGHGALSLWSGGRAL